LRFVYQRLQLEEVQTAEPHRLLNLAALALGSAVRIIELVECTRWQHPARN
jgi:hypothetical protein